MKWVTREHPRTDRIACPWLIRKFIDTDAEIVYVPSDQVLSYAEREGATSFDAPGAKYTHRGSHCSFETLIDEFKIDDPAITLLAKVVHGADVSEDRDATPSRRASLRSPTASPSSALMTNASSSSSCPCTTPCTRGHNTRSAPAEADGAPPRTLRRASSASRVGRIRSRRC